MPALDTLEAFIAGLDEKGKQELDGLLATELEKPWRPAPENEPQRAAYVSEADLLLYGGAAGGGKTDLLAGYAVSEAQESVIFRRQAKDLQAFWNRLVKLAPNPQEKNSVTKRLVTHDGRMIECGHLDAPGSEEGWQGQPHDFIGFDEGAQLTAYKVKFVLGWNRSATGKRCRAIIASNPPMGGTGDWLMEWFAPWLDPMFSDPAEPGELRWAITIGDEEEIRTVWVEGPGSYCEDGSVWSGEGEDYEALSRSFIPSKLDDNPYLRETGYRAQIKAMPEPLRSQLLHGDFLAGRKDHKNQVIPTAWVDAAVARWEANKDRPRQPMLNIGVDVAQGGADPTVVAPLRGVRFDELEERPGSETPDPVPVVEMVLGIRRDDANITVDHGGGYGGGVSSHLKTHNNIQTIAFVPQGGSGARTREGSLGFLNLRAESWWRFREDLDPSNPDHALIELPPDKKLKAQLTAPHWRLKGDKIAVESKDDIRKRLGSSTDKADAALIAWLFRGRALMRRVAKTQQQHTTVPMADPLADF